MALLDFFDPAEAFPLVLLILLLRWVGHLMAEGDERVRVRWWTRGTAAAAFLLFAALGIAYLGPETAFDYASVVFRAILSMGTAGAVASVVVPAVLYSHHHLVAEPRRIKREIAAAKAQQEAGDALRREIKDKERMEREKADGAERVRLAEYANRPPPPTREERMEAAKKRHDSAVAVLESGGLDELELKSGKEKCRQTLLKELDGLM